MGALFAGGGFDGYCGSERMVGDELLRGAEGACRLGNSWRNPHHWRGQLFSAPNTSGSFAMSLAVPMVVVVVTIIG